MEIPENRAMTTEEPKVIAGDKIHWYAENGLPIVFITGKNGKQRTPYIKEALTLGLVPGVTTITKQVMSYGLLNYFMEQGIWAALTNTKYPLETDDQFIARIKVDSKAHGKQRADEGSELHKAIDQYVLGQDWDRKWTRHITAIWAALELHGYKIKEGKPQVTFATKQYGGTADLVFPDAIFDWKTKESLDGKKKLTYDEHCMQLTAYDRGMRTLGGPRKLYNLFVGCKDGAAQVHCWNDPKEIERCWQKFQHLLAFWWSDNGNT